MTTHEISDERRDAFIDSLGDALAECERYAADSDNRGVGADAMVATAHVCAEVAETLAMTGDWNGVVGEVRDAFNAEMRERGRAPAWEPVFAVARAIQAARGGK